MFSVELFVFLTLSAMLGSLSLFRSLRTAMAQGAAIRQALGECPHEREMRFTVRTVVVRYNDGKVVPLRQPAPVRQPLKPAARAA